MRLFAIVLMFFLALAACGKAGAPDSVDFLVTHPDRLRKIEQQCANDYPKMGAAECIVASEARRRLFMGKEPQYTPPKKTPKF